MNFSNDGPNIAIVKSDDKDKNKTSPILSISYDQDLPNIKYSDCVDLPNKYKFQFIPLKNKERVSIYISGKNGSGKSYYIAQYLKEFHKMYPSYIIRLFSSKNEDDSLDSLPFVKRIKMDDSIFDDPINYEDLKESMVIFDDIDCLTKNLKKSIYDLRDIILKNGRSYKIHTIITNHFDCGKEQKACLNECDAFVFFPMNYNKYQRYFLESYIGLEKKEIQKIRKIKTRAITYISCTQPSAFLTEQKAFTKSYLEN